MNDKKIKEFETVLKELRDLLYDNRNAMAMYIHISLEQCGVPSITFEVEDRRVIVE